MGTPIAIVVGAGLIAGAILVANHWQAIPGTELGAMGRLNRWTGQIELCMADTSSITNAHPTLAGVPLHCK